MISIPTIVEQIVLFRQVHPPRTIMIEGKSGHGKTTMLREGLNSLGINTYEYHVSMLLDSIMVFPNVMKGTVNVAMLQDLQDILFDSTEPTVIMLEEIQGVQSLPMDSMLKLRALVMERTVGGRPISPEVSFVMIGNTSDQSGYGMETYEFMAEMLRNNLNYHTSTPISVEEWAKYALQKGSVSEVFINVIQEMLKYAFPEWLTPRQASSLASAAYYSKDSLTAMTTAIQGVIKDETAANSVIKTYKAALTKPKEVPVNPFNRDSVYNYYLMQNALPRHFSIDSTVWSDADREWLRSNIPLLTH